MEICWWTNIVRNGFLWSNEVSNSNIWKAQFVRQGFFLRVFSCNFNDQLSPDFHRFVILCICWDTPSEKTWSLTIITKGGQCLYRRCFSSTSPNASKWLCYVKWGESTRGGCQNGRPSVSRRIRHTRGCQLHRIGLHRPPLVIRPRSCELWIAAVDWGTNSVKRRCVLRRYLCLLYCIIIIASWYYLKVFLYTLCSVRVYFLVLPRSQTCNFP